MKLPFGKYRGHDIADVPLSYLEYLLKWDELHDDLRAEIEQEILDYRMVECIVLPDLFLEDGRITLREMEMLQRANRPLIAATKQQAVENYIKEHQGNEQEEKT